MNLNAILPEIVAFKSNSDFYAKEKSGRKPNTIRRFDFCDTRHLSLFFGLAKQICITCGTDCFTREITDVSFYGGWVIISWREDLTWHEGTKGFIDGLYFSLRSLPQFARSLFRARTG